MGHIAHHHDHYHLLQQRLDENIEGAPDSPTLMKILSLLFSPREAEFASKLPSRPTSLQVLSRKLSIPGDELADKLTEMARRGVVLDLEHEGQRYFSLSPVVNGFSDFTFMRTRNDVPMPELARLFDEYMYQDDRFAHSLLQSETQLYRSLVREEALPTGDHTEVLDWERASHIVRSASVIGLSLCSCRHAASHLGNACDKPRETCLSLNYGAEALLRSGNARPVTADRAMSILEECMEAGLAQTADNVQHKVTYICNCCSCCCMLMRWTRTLDIRSTIVTSNWTAEIDLSRCNGCGLCASACPTQAIQVVGESVGKKERKWAVSDGTLCIGCGVCYSTCKFGALTMKPRPRRVFTPETAFDRTVTMAIERGKLASLIFNNFDGIGYRALGRILGVLEKSTPFKAAMAVKPLRSVFLSTMVREAKRQSGDIAGVID